MIEFKTIDDADYYFDNGFENVEYTGWVRSKYSTYFLVRAPFLGIHPKIDIRRAYYTFNQDEYTMESMEYNLSMRKSEIENEVMVYETESLSGDKIKLYKTRQSEEESENENKLKLYFSCEFVFERGDSSTKRFIQNDELKYSLRSLEKNAPWIRYFQHMIFNVAKV